MNVIVRKATYRRFLIILILITFLFLPFSKPRQANAFTFPLAIPVLPVIGGTVLVLAGCVFLDSKMSEYQGDRLMKEHGDSILFRVKRPLSNFSEWKTGGDMTFDDWTFWNGDFRVPDEMKEDLDNFIDSIPTTSQPGSTELVDTVNLGTGTMSSGKTNKANFQIVFKQKVDNIIFEQYHEEYPVKIIFNISASTQFDDNYEIGTRYNCTSEFRYFNGWIKSLTVDGLGSVPNQYISFSGKNLMNKMTYDHSLYDIYQATDTIDYAPSVTSGASSEQYYERTYGKDLSIDKDKVGSVPISDDTSKSIEESLENSGVTTTESDKAITGWGWLDNILNAILSAIKSIPLVITDLWKDIVGLKDFVISIPDQVSIWWDSLWTDVPSVDFTPLTSIEISKVFPFSIPFDLKNLFEILLAEPQAPIFTIPLWTEEIEFDLTKFNLIANIIRVFCVLGWSFYLISRHKQMEE